MFQKWNKRANEKSNSDNEDEEEDLVDGTGNIDEEK